jgi:hypothetical protein
MNDALWFWWEEPPRLSRWNDPDFAAIAESAEPD